MNSFSEIGYFQTEAGERGQPAPPSNTQAQYNRWGLWAFDPLTVRALGRPASMVPDAWKQLPDDQAAVGLVNLRKYTDELSTLLPASIRPTKYNTQFAVAMAFTAFSAGTNGARNLFTRYATQLAALPEEQRWAQLVWLLARDIQNGYLPPGGAGRHGNVAYDALRTMQKLEAGRQLAVAVGGNAAWFDLGMGAGQAAEEAVIQRAAYGESTSGIAALSAPVLRSAGKGLAVLAALGLLAVGAKLLAPTVLGRANPSEDLIRRVRQMISFGLGPKEVVEALGSEYSRDDVYLAYQAAKLVDKPSRRKNPVTATTVRSRSTMAGLGFERDTIQSAGRYRIMKSGESAPCKSCKTSTKWAALSEEAGGHGYAIMPVCARHLPELRAAYDREGYTEHHRENPSRKAEAAGWNEHGEKCLGGGADQQYDHDKLVLAIHNRGDRRDLSGMSYGEVYTIARELKIRS